MFLQAPHISDDVVEEKHSVEKREARRTIVKIIKPRRIIIKCCGGKQCGKGDNGTRGQKTRKTLRPRRGTTKSAGGGPKKGANGTAVNGGGGSGTGGAAGAGKDPSAAGADKDQGAGAAGGAGGAAAGSGDAAAGGAKPEDKPAGEAGATAGADGKADGAATDAAGSAAGGGSADGKTPAAPASDAPGNLKKIKVLLLKLKRAFLNQSKL